jgi:hypothetical protein
LRYRNRPCDTTARYRNSSGLADVAIFAVAEILKLPLLEPLAGDTVSHVWLLVTDHEVFEVTETVVLAADAAGFHDVVFTVSVGVTEAVVVNLTEGEYPISNAAMSGISI